MTTSALAAPPVVRGEQRPRLLTVPQHASTDLGRDAVALAAKCGLPLHPWQQFVLEQSLARAEDGSHAAPDVGLVVSRQNGKGNVIVARQLAGLFLLDEPLQVYTSHKFTTTLEMHRRLKAHVYAYPPFARRVARTPGAGNDVAVELKSGQRVKFLARTADSGRGFSTDATLYLDEAMNLTDPEQDALLPTTTAAADPQVWYVGSAGVGEASRVFARIRRRGIAGDGRLLWCEWSVPEGADPDDQSLWGLANPGLGFGQVTARGLAGYRGNMSSDGFAREYLGVGDWPTDDDIGVRPIPLDLWNAVADHDSTCGDPVVFAVAVSLDGSHASIGVAGDREDGLTHVEVVEHRPGTHWVAARAWELQEKHAGSLLVLDAGTRANQLVPGLIEAGFVVHSGKDTPAAGSLVLLGGQDATAAFGGFVSAVTEDPSSLRHRPHPGLDAALAAATTRHVGQALAWDGKNLADISPLVGVTLAAHGLAKYGGAASTGFNIW